jgi:serine/threonine-protein kinase RsbW
MHRSHLRITATQHELQSVAATVEAFCATNDIPSATSDLMNLVLDEVLSNIAKYAYDAPGQGPIDIELEYSNATFTATVEDAGRPFDPLQFKRSDNSGPLKTRRQGGLGILFVKRLVDSVLYDRSGDRNKLTLKIKAPVA